MYDNVFIQSCWGGSKSAEGGVKSPLADLDRGFVDFEKAFDSVHRETLSKELWDPQQAS